MMDHTDDPITTAPRAPVAPISAAEAERFARAMAYLREHFRTASLKDVADHVGLSPFHFLRTFEKLTGITPHQYLRRARLRAAAAALLTHGPARIVDVALDAGFGDVSNFNHAFRAEFGVSPTVYRQRVGRPDLPAPHRGTLL